jgi:hypothetical protein
VLTFILDIVALYLADPGPRARGVRLLASYRAWMRANHRHADQKTERRLLRRAYKLIRN